MNKKKMPKMSCVEDRSGSISAEYIKVLNEESEAFD